MSQDAEEDGDDEEVSPCEGRCDVHDAATGSVLSAALCSPGKHGTNLGAEFNVMFFFCFTVSFTMLHLTPTHVSVSRLCSPLGGTDLSGSWKSMALPAPVGPCWEPVGPKLARSLKGYDLS